MEHSPLIFMFYKPVGYTEPPFLRARIIRFTQEALWAPMVLARAAYTLKQTLAYLAEVVIVKIAGIEIYFCSGVAFHVIRTTVSYSIWWKETAWPNHPNHHKECRMCYIEVWAMLAHRAHFCVPFHWLRKGQFLFHLTYGIRIASSPSRLGMRKFFSSDKRSRCFCYTGARLSIVKRKLICHVFLCGRSPPCVTEKRTKWLETEFHRAISSFQGRKHRSTYLYELLLKHKIRKAPNSHSARMDPRWCIF